MIGKIHDENQDVMRLSRNKIQVNQGTKTIKAPKGTIIGNKSWGRIDFLCHYKGYHFIWDNSVIDNSSYEDSDKKKNLRSIKKESKYIKNNRIMNS